MIATMFRQFTPMVIPMVNGVVDLAGCHGGGFSYVMGTCFHQPPKYARVFVFFKEFSRMQPNTEK